MIWTGLLSCKNIVFFSFSHLYLKFLCWNVIIVVNILGKSKAPGANLDLCVPLVFAWQPFLPLGMDVDVEGQGVSQFSSPDQRTPSEEADEGWVSWAWSFVPAIINTEEENEEGVYQLRETGGIPSNPQQQTLKDPVVSIGFYCTKASVTFKVNQLYKATISDLISSEYFPPYDIHAQIFAHMHLIMFS